MKKYLFCATILVLTILALAGSARATNISTPVDSLIRGSLPAVYYYAADGNRYVFPNERTFGSWFSNYSKVITISDEELAQIPLRGNITYRPGMRMVKIQTSPNVYVVSKGGKLRWVKTEELAEELYGENWNQLIDDIPDVFFVNYQEADLIASSTEYNPSIILSQVITINQNRGIQSSSLAPKADTNVGDSTQPIDSSSDLTTTPSEEGEYSISGRGNINPGSSSNNRFEMITPDGLIDIDTLADNGSSYVYAGSATEIKVKFKDEGRTLTINNCETQLTTSSRYTIASSSIMVNLSNNQVSGTPWSVAKSHWWIKIDATNASITPDPGVSCDSEAPIISNIQTSNITARSATITWDTDENSTSIVNYGTISNQYSYTATGATTTTHTINLTNLTVSTTYYYQVVSSDAAGNTTTSAQQSFTTLASSSPDTTPPVISNFQPTGTITDFTPTLSLNTDENATCRYIGGSTDHPVLPKCGTAQYAALCTIDQSFDTMQDTFNGAGTTYHYATMETMTAGTYTYYARCQDTAGNKNTDSASITFTITTTPIPDTTAPVISNIQISNITQTSATITWQTNEESNSIVDYGLTTSYGSTVSGETSVTYHEVDLTNLTDGTTYHYQVKSTDSAGNRALSGDKTFTTLTTACITLWDPVCGKNGKTYSNTCYARLANVEIDYKGECLEAECTDSDGGKDYYVKGTVTLLDPYESKTDSCTYCTGACLPDMPCNPICGAVVEYYCENNGITSELYLCPNGCRDGACLSADTTPPAEITNFTATVGDSQAAFSWTNPTDADFAGTMILRKTDSYPTSITDGTQLYDGTGTSYAEIGLTNGTTYYYTAFTHDEVPNFSSGAEVSATPTAPPPHEPAFLLKWGSEGSGDGQFNKPHGIAVDASGNVYVVEYPNNRVQKFTSDGTFITKWGSQGSDDGQFSNPDGIAVDASGNVYVADKNNSRIQKFTSDGTFILKWGSYGTGDGQFAYPFDIATDANSNVYVVDYLNHRVQKFTSDGTFIAKWGSRGYGEGQFYYPIGIAVDASSNVYVTNDNNNRIQKYTGDGTFITQWGSLGSSDGRFYNPEGIAVDTSGNVYVADFDNNRVQKFTSNGTFILKWGSEGSGDGQFDYPGSIAVDTSGNVYVADNNRVQKFESVTVLGISYSVNNPLDLQPGWLVKNKQYNKVFYVDENFCLHWIKNEQAAEKYFGPTWNQNIKQFDSLEEYEFCENLE